MKRLLIFALIAALPAAAISLKDWEAKPDDEQIKYLTASLARLVVAANKTDQTLADKIKHYYTDKPNGLKYPAGMLDLLQRIVRLENQAQTDRSVDLAKIELEDVILRNTAEKFILPASVASAGTGSGTKPVAPPKRDFQDVVPPRPPAPPQPRPAPTTKAGGGITPPPAKSPAPTRPNESMPTNDPIGTGGFIGPPVYEISNFEVNWFGRSMTVEGTVSRATVDSIVRLHFRESRDDGFQVHSPLIDEMRARYGRDLAGLVGKTIRVSGEITGFTMSIGGIRLTDMAQLKLVP